MDHERFVQEHTEVRPAPLVGLSLHLATEVTPLWSATELFLREHNIEPPYWAFAWPGSVALAAWVLGEPSIVRGRRVLDFAAGSGLAAIAALRAGAASAVAVEVDPLAGVAIRLNGRLNEVAPEVLVGDLTSGAVPEVDVLLTGDVCYSRPMVDKLLPWLRRCAAAGVEVYVADPGRMYLPTEGVEPVAVLEVPTLRDLEDRDVRTTRILRLGP